MVGLCLPGAARLLGRAWRNAVCAAGPRCSPPGTVLSRAHIYGYGRSLRPPQGTSIAPRRRAVFRQTLLGRLPAEVAAQQLVEAPVRLGEVLREPAPGLGLHLGVALLVDAGVRPELARRRAEELDHAGIRLPRLGGQLFARDDEQLLLRADSQPAFELLRVAPPGEIGVVPPGVAEIAGLPREPHLLPTCPLGLGLDRLLERELLAAERNLVMVVGQRAVDRVPQQRDQLGVGNGRPQPLGREWVKEV